MEQSFSPGIQTLEVNEILKKNNHNKMNILANRKKNTFYYSLRKYRVFHGFCFFLNAYY